MAPDLAVKTLADILAERREFTEDEVYAALADAGVPAAAADRAYKFTQTAWSQLLLGSSGVRFSPEYVCFDADGAVVETGKLADEAFYAAAARLARTYLKVPGFARLAAMSADFRAVNAALGNGAEPENLVSLPTFLFLEPPTAVGWERAQQAIAARASAMRSAAADRRPTASAKKPWWLRWRR